MNVQPLSLSMRRPADRDVNLCSQPYSRATRTLKRDIRFCTDGARRYTLLAFPEELPVHDITVRTRWILLIGVYVVTRLPDAMH